MGGGQNPAQGSGQAQQPGFLENAKNYLFNQYVAPAEDEYSTLKQIASVIGGQQPPQQLQQQPVQTARRTVSPNGALQNYLFQGGR